MRILFTILTLILPFFALGQLYNFSGSVTDYFNRSIIDADIVLAGDTLYFGKTDTKGKFDIIVKEGNYTITVFKTGYSHYNGHILLDKNKQKNFQLTNLSKTLDEVTVKAGKDNNFGITRLKQVEGTEIYASKKSEVIVLADVNANLATNNSRQIYSKVAGLNIWESDGAGIQLGIGGRGLSPNRVSNFNTRQNGYDISADALGYPESYYSPPAEALERIEIVRGAASLQYGTQFGGFINFKLKKGVENKPFEFVTRQTVGSFGLINSFNSVGGTADKFRYYAYYQHKQGNGWRENSEFNVNAAYGSVTYEPSSKLSVTMEYTLMKYLAQQPGGLTEVLFINDPQHSIRERNWFRVNWNLAALSIDYKINELSKINLRGFGLYAGRDALGFLGNINRIDPMQERDLLMDKYRNIGSELRFIQNYDIGAQRSTFLIGTRVYKGNTDRKQGYGNDGSGPDFYYLNPDNLEHSDYVFPSFNFATFSENIFQISDKVSITPGIRFEYIHTASEGYYNEEYRDLAGNIIFRQSITDNRLKERAFVLMGIGGSYRPTPALEFYGNFSQNYKSINFNDMRIVNPNSRVDPNLQDEKGYTADLGMRGNIENILNFDASLFTICYNNRIGSILKIDTFLYNIYRLRTNISNSRNYGLEIFAEADIYKLFKRDSNSATSLSLFTNLSIQDARYINSQEAAIENNKVELVPMLIFKTGFSAKIKQFQGVLQYAYTSSQFTDATNAEFTSNAVNGIIPAYSTWDLSLRYQYKRYALFTGINNLTNNTYFTRRADGYPGPGIIPSDGRNFYITLQAKF